MGKEKGVERMSRMKTDKKYWVCILAMQTAIQILKQAFSEALEGKISAGTE